MHYNCTTPLRSVSCLKLKHPLAALVGIVRAAPGPSATAPSNTGLDYHGSKQFLFVQDAEAVHIRPSVGSEGETSPAAAIYRMTYDNFGTDCW